MLRNEASHKLKPLIILEIYFAHNYFLIVSMSASQFSFRRNDVPNINLIKHLFALAPKPLKELKGDSVTYETCIKLNNLHFAVC